VLLAMLAGYVLLPMLHLPDRTVFLVGVLPAFLVVWIRRAVPEPEEWQAARQMVTSEPRFVELFQGSVLWITIPAIFVCATALTGHWAFMFWFTQHMRNLAEVAGWPEADRSRLPIIGLAVVVGVSILGNFGAAAIAGRTGYRSAIVAICLAYFAAMFFTYRVPRGIESMWFWLPLIGLCQGVFALFTMYLPPLFPTLLRTTGAGFCYNIGRLAAAFGTVFLGKLGDAGDYRQALCCTSFLFIPAALFALMLPELPPLRGPAEPLE
jgi:hypothetical protein